jgi:hypothetical protein
LSHTFIDHLFFRRRGMCHHLDRPNLVANNIDDLMLLISSMEHRLEKAKKETTIKKDDNITTYESPELTEMDRRIRIAKLVC